MPPARHRDPTDRLSFWAFLLQVLDVPHRVHYLAYLIIVTGATICAILSVYYLSTQHFPLWSEFVVPGGGISLSVLYRVFLGGRGRSSGTTLLGQPGSAGEIPQGPADGEHPPGDPREH